MITGYFAACSSGDKEYEHLTKDDIRNIDSFCICSNPFTSLINRIEKQKDSAGAIKNSDSLIFYMKNMQSCLEYLEKLTRGKHNEKEFDTEMLMYIKKNYPECYSFISEKEGKEK
jgi:hypothetical protein